MFGVQVADVIRGVARRMNGLERELTGFESIAIVENVIRSESLVLVTPFRRRPAVLLRARGLGQQRGAGRMIGMRMGDEYPADRRTRSGLKTPRQWNRLPAGA